MRSVLVLMRPDLEAPDHTTLSRRSQRLDLVLDRIPARGPLHLIVDSTGLSIVGEGEWAAAKHGGRGKRGWKKLHLGVDRSGVIVAQALTEPTADDATTGMSLIEQADGQLARVTADAAYDTIAFYDAAGARRATVVVPPARTASLSRRGPRSRVRDSTIKRVKVLGRRRWKKASGYHLQARVESAFFRYKSIIGGGLRARTPRGRQTEALLACNVGLLHVSVESCNNACAGKARSRGTRCRDVIFETLFETLWVSNPIRPRSAASRNRVMRGPGVTQGAKRSQGARRPRN